MKNTIFFNATYKIYNELQGYCNFVDVEYLHIWNIDMRWLNFLRTLPLDVLLLPTSACCSFQRLLTLRKQQPLDCNQYAVNGKLWVKFGFWKRCVSLVLGINACIYRWWFEISAASQRWCFSISAWSSQIIVTSMWWKYT